MDYIKSFFPSGIKGKVQGFINSNATSSTAIFGSVAKLKAYLATSVNDLGVFNQSFLGSFDPSDFLADHGSIMKYTDVKDSITFVSGDSISNILEGCNYLSENSDDSTIEVSDHNGATYRFYFFEGGNDQLIDGYVIYAAYDSNPDSLDDCVIFRKKGDDNIAVREIIRSFNFHDNDLAKDVFGILVHVAAKLELQAPTSILDGLQKVATFYSLQVKQSIEEQCVVINDHISASSFVNVFDLALKLYAYSGAKADHLTLGGFTTFYDLLYDTVESESINSVMHDMCDLLTSTRNTLSDFSTIMQEKTYEKYSSVRSIVNSVRSAYIQGGVFAAASTLLKLFSSAGSLTEEDGKMVFTDNSKLVPQQYISGIISGFFQTLGAVITAIALVVGHIVGAVIAIIGTIFSTVFKSISYSADATRAGVQTSGNAVFPLAPYGIIQQEFSRTVDKQWLFDIIESYGQCVVCDVPGGSLICGPGETTTDEYGETVLSTIRCEFHASIDDRTDAIISALNDKECGMHTSWAYEYPNPFTNLMESAKLDSGYATREALVAGWSTDPVPHAWNNNTDDNGVERLSAVDDAALKRIVIFNTWVFLTYLISDDENEHNVVNISSGDELQNPNPTDTSYSDEVVTRAFILANCPFFSVQSVEHVWGDPELDDHANGRYPCNYYSSWSFITSDMIRINNANSFIYHLKKLSVQVSAMVNTQDIFGIPVPIPYTSEWAIVPPTYDGSTFYLWIVLTGVALIAATALVISTSLKWRKLKQFKRAQNNAKVEKAWDEYKKNPSNPDAYSAYRSTVRKSNFSRLIFGGTKYDYENYWNGDTSGSGSASTVTSGFFSSVNETDTDETGGIRSSLDRIEVNGQLALYGEDVINEQSKLNRSLIEQLQNSVTDVRHLIKP